MSELVQKPQEPSESENATLLWIAWEMTQQTSQATKASRLQKDFAENLQAVLKIWISRTASGDEVAVVPVDDLAAADGIDDTAQVKKAKRGILKKK